MDGELRIPGRTDGYRVGPTYAVVIPDNHAKLQSCLTPYRRIVFENAPFHGKRPSFDMESRPVMIELTLDIGERAANAALAQAKQMGTVMTATVVDESGRTCSRCAATARDSSARRPRSCHLSAYRSHAVFGLKESA